MPKSSSKEESCSDEDSSSESDSDAESEVKKTVQVPLPNSESSTSSSESDSDSDSPSSDSSDSESDFAKQVKKEVKEAKKKEKKESSGSETSVTVGKEPPKVFPVSTFAPLPPDPTIRANNRGKKNGDGRREPPRPFSRIKEDVVVGPRLAFNAFAGYEWGHKLVLKADKGRLLRLQDANVIRRVRNTCPRLSLCLAF